ncbi:MAG: hypothetical protein SVY53_05545 [Chloroflexota bacterium]|nr:hypothetical protein [Chloroflexota bacterium]
MVNKERSTILASNKSITAPVNSMNILVKVQSMLHNLKKKMGERRFTWSTTEASNAGKKRNQFR